MMLALIMMWCACSVEDASTYNASTYNEPTVDLYHVLLVVSIKHTMHNASTYQVPETLMHARDNSMT